MAEVDDSDLSEITILPDGRVYAFGITRPIKEILVRLQSEEDATAPVDRRAAVREHAGRVSETASLSSAVDALAARKEND